jgi:signal peptidase
MSLRSVAYTVLVGLLVLVAVLVGAGSVLGQPILLSYVETGSMEPTLEPGDGFAAISTAVTSPVEGEMIRGSKESHAAGLHLIRFSKIS